MNTQITPMNIIATLYLVSASTSASAAAAYYQASITNLDRTLITAVGTNTTGAFYEYDLHRPRNGDGLSSYASSESRATSMNLFGKTTTNSFLTISMGGVARGRAGFDDIIFTDSTNSGSTGTIDVSVNIFNDLTTFITGTHTGLFGSTIRTSAEFSGTVALTPANGGGFDAFSTAGNLFNGSMNGADFTTGTITVDLNRAYTLSISSELEFRSDINTDAEFFASMGLGGTSGSSSSASLNHLGTNPFNLPSGYTVNSVQAGIVNNSVSAVPVPASLWLFGSGLIGLIGLIRRKTN